jgi:hypothetical protein
LALESQIGVGCSIGRCLLRLGDISWADPQIDDPITVQLDGGDGATVVFTGDVERISQHADALWVFGSDSLAKMARIEVESAYEEVTAGFIVKDLIEQAGAEAGEIEDGPTFPSYVVHRGPRALRHAQRLAELVGAELSSDGEGKVHFRRPRAEAAAHRLVWAEDLIELGLDQRTFIRDSFAVWGEGAAGTDGSERGHWLPTDLSGVSGEAAVSPGAAGETGRVTADSTGDFLRTTIDGAIRAAETAGDVASARAQLVALRPLAGHVVTLGRPSIMPGQWVDLVDLPSGNGGRTLCLRVRCVIQEFANHRGLLTRLEF